MAICETCDYSNRPPYKSPCSECDKTIGSPFCCYEHEEKPNNADRIRAMSDEDMAKWLLNFFWGASKSVKLFDLLKWLKQTAEKPKEESEC